MKTVYNAPFYTNIEIDIRTVRDNKVVLRGIKLTDIYCILIAEPFSCIIERVDNSNIFNALLINSKDKSFILSDEVYVGDEKDIPKYIEKFVKQNRMKKVLKPRADLWTSFFEQLDFT